MGGEGAEDRGRICSSLLVSSAAAQPTIPPSGNADLKTRAKLYRRAGSNGSDIPSAGLCEDLAEVEHKLQREKEDESMEQKEPLLPCRGASNRHSDPGPTIGAETSASQDDQFRDPAIRKSAPAQAALQESAPAKRDSTSRRVVVADDHEVFGEQPLPLCQNGRRVDIRKQDCGESAPSDAVAESDKLPPVTDAARPASMGAASDTDSGAGSDAAVADPEECDWTAANAVNSADLKNLSQFAGDEMMQSLSNTSGKAAGDSMMQKLSSMSGRSGKASASQDGRPGTGSGIRGALGTARNAIASILPSRPARGVQIDPAERGGMAQQLLQIDPGSVKGEEPAAKHTAHSGSALEPRSLREELAQRNLPSRSRNRGENSQAAASTSGGSADAAADRSHRRRRPK